MNKLVYISDFFANEVQGGAEIYDSVLIDQLKKKGIQVATFKSSEFGLKHLDLYLESDFNFIISNFTQLPEVVKRKLEVYGDRYAILEHDHKYIIDRNPSNYNNFKVPTQRMVNQSFYNSAKAVFCQSIKHAEVVSMNLSHASIVNLGCSLWSDEQLNIIKNCLNVDKNNKCFVLGDMNPIKGLEKAKTYCINKKIDHDVVPKQPYQQYIEALAAYDSLAFFPQTLESFCRLVVEARMLNCKLKTNELNGCTYEPWFKKYKGAELVSFIESKREEIVEAVSQKLFEKSDSQQADLTVILNCYRRPYNLQMQVDALRAQSVQPKEIWLWINYHEDNKDFDPGTLGVDRVFKNDFNWKFYGRFAAALLADTEYVAIYDDDTIPGSNWHKNCLETMHTQEGIMGSAGYIQTGDLASQYYRHGWPSQNEQLERVDYVGHAWFFKREWLSHLWREKPPTWDNGEDMHFSYTSQKYGGIQTYCPPHPPGDKSMHGSLLGNELGIDSKATSNNQAVSHGEFFSQRDMCIRTALNGGWDTVKKVK